MYIFGVPVVLILAVAVYMAATVFQTEVIKRMFPRIAGGLALATSWLVGFAVFFLLYGLGLYPLDVTCIALFAVITGLLNSWYKFGNLSAIVKWVFEKKFGGGGGFGRHGGGMDGGPE
jgi:hypothetical protein